MTVEADTGRLERGIAVFDTTWKVKHQMVDTVAYQKSDAAAPGGLVVNQSVFDLLPGEYILGAQFKDLGSGGYGSQFKKINVEHYSGAELEISDIEVALEISEDYQSAYKSGLQVIPNPTRIFDREKPVKIYYEIYGLSKDAFGQTHYQVDYHVSPMETEKRLVAKVLKAIGKVVKQDSKETVTITTKQTSYQNDQNEYLELEVNRSEPGDYKLTVILTDQVADASVSKEARFKLIRR